MEAQRLTVDLLNRRMERCRERRALPTPRSDFGEHVLTGEAERKEPAEQSHALVVGESLAVEGVHDQFIAVPPMADNVEKGIRHARNPAA